MKKLTAIIFILWTTVVFSQSDGIYTPNIVSGHGYQAQRIKPLLTLHIPILPDTLSLHDYDTSSQIGIYNGQIYYHYKYWRNIIGSSGGGSGDFNFDSAFATKTTDNLTQGSTNLYNQTHTGDATGATALTVVGIRSKSIPSLSAGFLKYSGTAWSFDNSTYLTSIDTTNISNFSVKVRSLFSATSPLAYSNGVFSIQQANTSQGGYLSATDWNTFNGKLSNITGLITEGSNITITGIGTSGSPYNISSTGGGITSIDYVVREIPSGSINGSNTTFTLANTPVTGKEMVFENGLLQEVGGGNDYTISTNTITFVTAPPTGSKIVVTYLK